MGLSSSVLGFGSIISPCGKFIQRFCPSPSRKTKNQILPFFHGFDPRQAKEGRKRKRLSHHIGKGQEKAL